MNVLHRFFVVAFVVFSLFLIPLLHARSEGARGFNPRQPFLATGDAALGALPAGSAPMSWQAVPLAGRLVGQVPQDFDRWQWAANDSLTLIVHSTAGRPDGVIYVETVAGGPWAGVELDGFHRTVAPHLSSEILPWFASRPPGLVEVLRHQQKFSESDVMKTLAHLRSRTLGRGLGFLSSRTAFSGWRWVGTNPQGVRLRLGRLEGTWGAQQPLDEDLKRHLEVLKEHSPELSALNAAGFASAADSAPPRAASLVLGSALLRRDLGVHFAVLFEQGAERSVVHELAAWLESLRPLGRGEMQSLLEARGQGELERLVRRMGWYLQLGAGSGVEAEPLF